MSKIKVNEIENRTGSTLILGKSGTTIQMACGATQTGFGRTGTVDWCTTAKTSPFTAVNGDGFFVNTSAGGITVTLPSSPSPGDIVAFKDYADTWQNNNVTICRNGSKINGSCANGKLSTEAQSVTLIYIDGTKGWKDIHDSTAKVSGAQFVAACGGNATITQGDFKTHIFTADGPLNVTSAGNPAGSTIMEYLVVAGAGAGGITSYGGGGGAGGFRMFTTAPGSNSPLNAPAGLAASVSNFTITVGGGGAAPNPTSSGGTLPGDNSIFSSITATGGGVQNYPSTPGGSGRCAATLNGGSGAGGAADGPAPEWGGSGNTPPVSPPQGNDGGTSQASPGGSNFNFGGGGGGAGAAGNPGNPPASPDAGAGGAGSYIADPFIGPTAPSYGTPGPVSSTRYFAGGGGGGSNANTPFPGTQAPGANGGGAGGVPNHGPQPGSGKNKNGGNGTANTGSGGGGAGYAPSPNNDSGTGGSGIVMIRYKFQ